MTLHVCVLGIDGSGKSTITAALPGIFAAEMNLQAGSAGEAFRFVGPDEDHLASHFYPDGLPIPARLAVRLKRAAKQSVNNRRLYPIYKLAHMIFQDSAARRLGERYRAPLIISDGNTFLSATGRAANYLRPASGNRTADVPAPNAEDLKNVFSYIFDGQSVSAESQRRLPRLWKGKLIYKTMRLLGLDVSLPDVVIFLDLSPAVAIERIMSRRQKIDHHENEADLTQAREMYLKTIEAFRRYRSNDVAHCIDVDDLTLQQTVGAVIEALRPHILAQQTKGTTKRPLGTSGLTTGAIRGKALNYRYVTHYLMAKAFSGAWREPTFFFSGLGRLFLKEGYSAGVMRAIYDRDEKQHGLLDRVFLEYPLHRAVYDRLQILTKAIEPQLEARLRGGQEVRIFTAPSGFAYDLFRPLESIAKRMPDAMRQVQLVAADLDPHDVLANELNERAARLKVEFKFLRGDLTSDEMRAKFSATAPYDLILFVGLSSWLPKPQLLQHFRWVRENITDDGLFITDSFTPEAYALSGRYVGYKAHYYTPEVYKAILDYCGFESLGAQVASGRDRINHVLLAAPREHQRRGAFSDEQSAQSLMN